MHVSNSSSRAVRRAEKYRLRLAGDEHYPDGWYPIAASSAVARKKPLGLRRLGRDLVLFRDASGAIVVAGARCPHRGASLALGRVRNGQLECGYHGFRFGSDGTCEAAPCEGPAFAAPKRLSLQVYRSQVSHGIVWLGHGAIGDTLPIPAGLPAGERGSVTAELHWNTPFPRAIEGQLDLHHFPFAHRRVFGPTIGARLDPFEAVAKDDIVTIRGTLRKEGKSKGIEAELNLAFPGTLSGTFGGMHLSGFLAPIDAEHTAMIFRYTSGVPIFGKILAWLAVQTELRLVQPDDEALLLSTGAGFDPKQNVYVPADQGFLLWLRRYHQGQKSASALQSIQTPR